MKKCQEEKCSWHELWFRFGKIEMVATRGYYGKDGQLGAFLGVSAPSRITHDMHFILFSPEFPAETTACLRMLRNYRKKASLNKWCFKSSFFCSMGFVTPNQLQLHEQEPVNYASVCSHLLNLAVNDELVGTDFDELKKSLAKFEFCRSLDFESEAKDEDVLKKLEAMKTTKNQKGRKLSKAKCLLIEVILNHNLQLDEKTLMLLYSGIIYPKVKNINKKRATVMENKLSFLYMYIYRI